MTAKCPQCGSKELRPWFAQRDPLQSVLHSFGLRCAGCDHKWTAQDMLAQRDETIRAVYELGPGPIEQAMAIPLPQWVKTRFVHVEEHNRIVGDLQTERDEEIKGLRELLRSIQWAPTEPSPSCPVCHEYKDLRVGPGDSMGHAPNCPLAAALAAKEPPPRTANCPPLVREEFQQAREPKEKK